MVPRQSSKLTGWGWSWEWEKCVVWEATYLDKCSPSHFGIWYPLKGAHAQRHIHSSDSPQHCDNVQGFHKTHIEVGHTRWYLEHKWELLGTPKILVESVATRFKWFYPLPFLSKQHNVFTGENWEIRKGKEHRTIQPLRLQQLLNNGELYNNPTWTCHPALPVMKITQSFFINFPRFQTTA